MRRAGRGACGVRRAACGMGSAWHRGTVAFGARPPRAFGVWALGVRRAPLWGVVGASCGCVRAPRA
eukprot:1969133-Prymnesium_polylepis.1